MHFSMQVFQRITKCTKLIWALYSVYQNMSLALAFPVNCSLRPRPTLSLPNQPKPQNWPPGVAPSRLQLPLAGNRKLLREGNDVLPNIDNCFAFENQFCAMWFQFNTDSGWGSLGSRYIYDFNMAFIATYVPCGSNAARLPIVPSIGLCSHPTRSLKF